MEFDSNRPIYIQIAEALKENILSGRFEQGGRIPSVREWGSAIGVNPNTVARSYSTLEQAGIITNRRGLGFYVSEQAREKIRNLERENFIREEIPAFLKKAELLEIKLKDYLK